MTVRGRQPKGSHAFGDLRPQAGHNARNSPPAKPYLYEKQIQGMMAPRKANEMNTAPLGEESPSPAPPRLPWKQRRLRRKLNKAAKAASKQENTFVVEHGVSKAFQFAPDFKIDKFNGLIFCQLIAGDGCGRKVVSYWKSRDGYHAAAGPFRAALGSNAEMTAAGLHCATRTGREPLHRRISILPVILFITTVLGFWKTMNDQYNEWFEPPQLEIFAERDEPFRIAVGDDASVNLFLRNESISTKALVKVVKCFLSDGVTNWSAFKSTRIAAVEKGEKLTQRVPLTFPKAGGYVLRAEALVKTGKFMPLRTTTNYFQIQVWPVFGFDPPKILTLTSNHCQIATPLISGLGSTNQVKCEALLRNNQGVCFENVTPSADDPIPTCDTEAKIAG